VTWELPISPQTLVDEVNEAGEPWGLVGEYDDEQERVFVCEVRPAVERGWGILDATIEDTSRRLMSVDHVARFSNVLRNRISAIEAPDPATRFHRADMQRKKREAELAEAHKKQWESATRLRRQGGIRVYSGMEKDLWAFRQARRMREEIRKRGG
jgi:hypothetical protein